MKDFDHSFAIGQATGKSNAQKGSSNSLSGITTCVTLPNAIHLKVLILTYNPWLATKGMSLFQYESDFDPLSTSEQIKHDLCEASGGFVDIQIVDRINRAEFPPEENGLRLTELEYLQLKSQGLSYWHVHGVRTDMKAVIEQGNLNQLVKNRQVDEIWYFGSWTFSLFEAYMGGPGAFFVNGPTFEADSGRAFVVMGFENAVGVPNSLHSIGHRVESTLDRAYQFGGGHNLDSPWARFRKNPSYPPTWLPDAPMGVGDIHHPPNTSADYDYTNQTTVFSNADDWLNFPNLTGQVKPVNAQTWGNIDHGYYKWWFGHLPRADGVSPRADSAPSDLRQNNWWKYVFQFNDYLELVGLPLSTYVSIAGGGNISKIPDRGNFYFPSDTVTLTANPDAGWAFDYWTVSYTGTTNIIYTNPVTVSMSIGHYVLVSANFKQAPIANPSMKPALYIPITVK